MAVTTVTTVKMVMRSTIVMILMMRSRYDKTDER